MSNHTPNQDQSRARPTAPKKKSEKPSRLSILERERAENEGMIAPPPAEAESANPELEGEGSYTASRRYREGVEASIAKGDTDELAEEAKRALESPEGAALREAERVARRRGAR